MSHLSNVRYGYFDAMRGTSMILVVYSHIMVISFSEADAFNLFFGTFRLPLFFFVSGFFAYKPLEIWDRFRMKDIITRKFKVQIIGATIFAYLNYSLLYGELPGIFFLLGINPYWFTFTLFKIFISYIAVVCISKAFHCRKRIFWSTLVSMAVLCFCLHFFLPELIPLMPSFLYQIIFHVINDHYFYFTPYFILGMVARNNIGEFEKIISSDIVKAVVISVLLVIFFLMGLGCIPMMGVLVGLGQSELSYPLGFLSLLLVVQFFYSIRREFDRDTKFSKSMRLIGRRTLDIYFIHYFFIPDLHLLSPYIIQKSDLPLFVVGIVSSLIVVGCCLLVGQVIRMSPTLAEWLLGVRNNKKAGAPVF